MRETTNVILTVIAGLLLVIALVVVTDLGREFTTEWDQQAFERARHERALAERCHINVGGGPITVPCS